MKRGEQFDVIFGYANVAPFLEKVRSASDANRIALGFIPTGLFEEFARRENLYLIVEKIAEGYSYAGHLLFERRFPRAHILQMFVHEQYRRHGLAGKLLAYLCRRLTHDGFTSAYARVAEDLTEANAFWDSQEFNVQRIERGGVARNRQILVRCRELESPQLFPTSGINAGNPLGLSNSSGNTVPVFLLDLNVLYDLRPRRLRHIEAANLFQAERMNYCRLAISSELADELTRTSTTGKTDPMEDYLRIFPCFPVLQDDRTEALLKELASLVFPGRSDMPLTANDQSDLRHVATAIQHNLAGFVTNDKAILSAAHYIQSRYGLEVISPAAFSLDEAAGRENNAFDTSSTVTLALREVEKTEEADVRSLLTSFGLSGSDISAGWLISAHHTRIARRLAVWEQEVPIAYMTWPVKEQMGSTNVRMAIDEASARSTHAARILLIYLLEQLSSDGPRQISLEFPIGQSRLRDLAPAFGFRGMPHQRSLRKIILGEVLTKDTWLKCRESLSSKIGIKLPAEIPTYRGPEQQIQVLTPEGNQTHLTLELLESLLSPALFCLPKRPAVITPVLKIFAEPLLGHSPQLSLLPEGTVSLFQDRHYLSDRRNIHHFKRGSLILFYESGKRGGQSGIVAIARVCQAYLKSADSLGIADLEQSVLSPSTLSAVGKSKLKAVTVFDNIFRLPQPVPRIFLERIGCGQPNDLISTHPITDTQLQEILKEGFNHAQ